MSHCLVSTSVDDCHMTLDSALKRDPVDCLKTAVYLLEKIRFSDGQSSRRKVALSFIKKSVKAIEEQGK